MYEHMDLYVCMYGPIQHVIEYHLLLFRFILRIISRYSSYHSISSVSKFIHYIIFILISVCLSKYMFMIFVTIDFIYNSLSLLLGAPSDHIKECYPSDQSWFIISGKLQEDLMCVCVSMYKYVCMYVCIYV